MPKSAIDNADIDYILTVSDMASVLEELVTQPVAEAGVIAVSDEMEQKAGMAELELDAVRSLLLKNELSMVNGEVAETANRAIALANHDLPATAEQRHSIGDFKLIVLCASAGGLNALSTILSALSANLPAAIAIVQHIAPKYPSHLADILSRRTALKVKQAAAEDVLRPGHVYIAPPDRHLLVNPDGTLSLSQTELVHFVRPSADLLLESAAASFKHQAIGVILTGTGSDGAMGIMAIKKMGGITIAQDKATSEFFGMPQAAIKTGSVDRVVPLNEIAATLVNLVNSMDEHEQFGA